MTGAEVITDRDRPAESAERARVLELEDVHTYRAPNPLPPGPFPDPQPVAGQVVVGKDGKPTFPGTVETWFTLLDRGHKATGIGSSDTHHLTGDERASSHQELGVLLGRDLNRPGRRSGEDVGGVEAARAAVGLQ